MTTRCTTYGCDHPGVVAGQFDDWGEQWNVNYCIKCASVLWADGSFTPNDTDQLHKAEQLSEWELHQVARMEAAPPAPESFDAVAAVRRVMALADELEKEAERICASSPQVCEAYSATADHIRAAIEGDSA